MPKYHVTGSVRGSKYLGVYEADTPEQAVEMALEGPNTHVSMCHQCSEECEDGTVEDATASEAEDSEDAQ